MKTSTADFSEAEALELELPPEIPEVIEPALVEPISVASRTISDPVAAADSSHEPTYEPMKPVAKSGFLRGFLSALLLLVVGGLLGIAGTYYLFQPKPVGQQQVQPTPDLEPKAPPKFASFEKLRRDVDADPEKYLEANKAYLPDADAADFYLKGRAFLRLNNYFEAKQALLEARKRLKPDTDDAATLETEIAMALAVIANAPASESLRKDLADWANARLANVASNSNAASNSANSGAANLQSNSNR